MNLSTIKNVSVYTLLLSLCAIALGFTSTTRAFPPATAKATKQLDQPKNESLLLSKTRQLTFEGRRAGEGYFNANGSELVFQSERDKNNPFFQIFLMDMTTGDTEKISPGHGKTTCAWIHPNKPLVLFSSTHDDPDAKKKQKAELDLRASGKQKRYSWDYDLHYEIYAHDRNTGKNINLTNTKGYDAEGSYSPDGKQIAFASNRRAYTGKMTKKEAAKFKIDPASMIDIYIMNADGSHVKRLTTSFGYDGGPFFSPDGKRICWRRFSEDGATAEIMTMNVNGTDKKRITQLGAMSWAPYYHPSGKYLIFTTNKHGFANFELYLIDTEGKSKPVRVTNTAGFDGLPVFTPNGRQLSWTTNRTSTKQSQIFRANWNHEAALKLLKHNQTSDTKTASPIRNSSASKIRPGDIIRHVEYLCRDDLAGRLTGTDGEKKATEYVATLFEDYGLIPAGDDGTYFQSFEFTAGVALGKKNKLTDSQKNLFEVKKDWQPVSFSANGKIDAAEIVFAGYGLVAPENKEKKMAEYDSYVHLDVKDKWVIIFRFMPEEISPERRQHLASFSSLRYKAMVARDKGAKGLILVSGPTSKVKNQLVPLRSDGSLSGSSLPIISVSDITAQKWFTANKLNLETLQKKLDKGDPAMGILLKNITLAATIDVLKIKKRGRNVLARLQVGEKPSPEVVLIGAHVDHLGRGTSSSSLAKENEKNQIHYGADDNASGTAAMLEIAESFSHAVKKKSWKPKRDILFAAWSGEELGLLGSSHFATDLMKKLHKDADKKHAHHHHAKPANPHAVPTHPHAAPHAKAPHTKDKKQPHTPNHKMPNHKIPSKSIPSQKIKPPSLSPYIAACFNMDMIGRLDKSLVLQGIGSSSIWKSEIERRNVPIGLSITLQSDSYLPTDASTFFIKGVPILSAFTGSHEQYHTPRDTPDKLDYEGAAKIAQLMALIAKSVAQRDKSPDYIPQISKDKNRPRAMMRAYLGTIPDYAAGDVKGVQLSGVSKGGPASKAGVLGGDIIVELAGKKIDNIYDYTYAIEAIKIGKPVSIIVDRKGKRIKLSVTPGSRQ